MTESGIFEVAWRAIEPYTMLGQDRGRVLWDLARESGLNVPHGAVAELGVYKGGSAMLLRLALPGCPLHLFDTFTGHPPHNTMHDSDGAHPAGRFADVSAAEVATVLGSMVSADGPAITLHMGRFPLSVAGLSLPRLAFVHVDADLYASVGAACREFWPTLEHGGVMVFDDYGFPDCIGAKRAVDEWAAVDPEMRELHLPGTGQAWVRKP